jgi:hypothetical protein
MGTEKLKFKLELFATMWDKPPVAEILINDESQFKGDITTAENNPTIIEFELDLDEEKEYNLIIKKSGKDNKQTVMNEKGNIIKDQLLHIKSIEIDEISLGGLVFTGIYTPNYPEPWAIQQRDAGVDLKESFTNATIMGHDGTWKIAFTTPFYMWLLENLY